MGLVRGISPISVLALVFVAGGMAAPGAAEAGRTPYGWLEGTEVLPERGAEIQTWITEENGKPNDVHDTALLWTAQIGVTDRLEVSFPVELLRRAVGDAPAAFGLSRFGAQARYRLVSQDPVDAPALAPLVRVAVKRDVNVRDLVRAEAGLALSFQSGRIQALAELGGAAELTRDSSHTELRPGGGVSVRVVGDLRLGAEAFGQISLDSQRPTWLIAGPNLAWTHGRAWVSAAFGIGLYQIDTAPRVIWGILF